MDLLVFQVVNVRGRLNSEDEAHSKIPDAFLLKQTGN